MFRRKKKRSYKSHVQCTFPAKVAVFEIIKQKDSRLHIPEFVPPIRSQHVSPTLGVSYAFPYLQQAFHYSAENAFYIFNQHIYFII